MNPLIMEILPLVRQGYCCSQLLMLVLLQSLGEEDSAEMHPLLRSANGLCFGMGGSEGACGLLTGGALVLGLLAGKGKATESAHPSLKPLVHDYAQWFAEEALANQGTRCFDVMAAMSRDQGLNIPARGEEPSPALCGDLLAACWERILLLLESYDIPLEYRP